jgi:Gpi18-like mannosyltransferase
MRHILVVDESGMPVYYDQKDGLMLCPIVSAVYNMMKGSFEESIKSWSCGNCKFLLKTVCKKHYYHVGTVTNPISLHHIIFLHHLEMLPYNFIFSLY